jgi:lactate permease
MATPYQPDITAVGDSVFLTAMVSIIPLAVVFIFLGVLKTKAHFAALAGLAASILVAILAFGMPVDLTLLGAS